MKRFITFVACLGVVCAALPALAQAPRAGASTVHIESESGGAPAFQTESAPHAMAALECRQVIREGRSQRLCGNAGQWQVLSARLGLSCRKVRNRLGTGSHIVRAAGPAAVCATAEEWRRLRRPQSNVISNGESTTEQNHPTNTFSATPTFPQ